MRNTVKIWLFILLDMLVENQWECWVCIIADKFERLRDTKKKYLIVDDDNNILNKVLNRIKI